MDKKWQIQSQCKWMDIVLFFSLELDKPMNFSVILLTEMELVYAWNYGVASLIN